MTGRTSLTMRCSCSRRRHRKVEWRSEIQKSPCRAMECEAGIRAAAPATNALIDWLDVTGSANEAAADSPEPMPWSAFRIPGRTVAVGPATQPLVAQCMIDGVRAAGYMLQRRSRSAVREKQ